MRQFVRDVCPAIGRPPSISGPPDITAAKSPKRDVHLIGTKEVYRDARTITVGQNAKAHLVPGRIICRAVPGHVDRTIIMADPDEIATTGRHGDGADE